MGLKGGYTIIDLSGYSFTAGGSAVKVPGLVGKLGSKYKKPVLLTGLTVGGVPVDDMWVNFNIAGGGFEAVAGEYSIVVAGNNDVTIKYYSPLNPPTMIPTSNGTYTLKGTKSTNGFTYDWVKDT